MPRIDSLLISESLVKFSFAEFYVTGKNMPTQRFRTFDYFKSDTIAPKDLSDSQRLAFSKSESAESAFGVLLPIQWCGFQPKVESSEEKSVIG